LTVYVGLFVFFAVAGILVWVFRHHATRECPRCRTPVQLGKTRCQRCGYLFTDARY
jgi:transposase